MANETERTVEKRLSPDGIITLKQTLKDEQAVVQVSDHMAQLIGARNQEMTEEEPTGEWRIGMAAIIGEGLTYISSELPGAEWMSGFYAPEVISDALVVVQAQNAAAGGQNG